MHLHIQGFFPTMSVSIDGRAPVFNTEIFKSEHDYIVELQVSTWHKITYNIYSCFLLLLRK